MTAPAPENENERLEKLKSFRILDTKSEPSFDIICEVLSKYYKVPYASISFVDEERQWNKAYLGYINQELYRGLSFCAHALNQKEPLVIKNTIEDDRFAQNPQVTSKPFLRFYAGAPLVSKDGFVLGTVSIADKNPREFSESEAEFLKSMAALVMNTLENSLNTKLIQDRINAFEESRLKLLKEKALLDKLLKFTSNIVYLYNYADRKVYFCNKQEQQLPFANQVGQLPAERVLSILNRFEKLKAQDSIEFKFKNMQVRECVISHAGDGTPDVILGVASDLTSAAELEQQLQDMTSKLRKNALMFTSILNTLTEGIIVADEAGTYLYFNSTAERLMGIGMSAANSTLWSNTYGFFYADKTTPVTPEDKPLAKAIRGLRSDQVEVFVRNSALPQGASLLMNGSPLYDEDGKLRGGIVTFRNVTEIKTAKEQLANLNQTDELTKLPNSRALLNQLNNRVNGPEPKANFALAIFDIDQFQKINDQQGVQMGDRLLQSLAKTLKWRVRKQDYLGRLKNDEFYMIINDVDQAAALRLVEGLKKVVAESKEPFAYTVCVGLSMYTGNYADDMNLFIKSVDDALFNAKGLGKSSVYSGR